MEGAFLGLFRSGGRGGDDGPVVFERGAGDVGVADAETGLVLVERSGSEHVWAVAAGGEESLEGGFDIFVARAADDGFDLVLGLKGGEFKREAVAGAGDVVVRADAVGIDMAEVGSLAEVSGAGAGDFRESGAVDEFFSFLAGVASHEGGHGFFFGGAPVVKGADFSPDGRFERRGAAGGEGEQGEEEKSG